MNSGMDASVCYSQKLNTLYSNENEWHKEPKTCNGEKKASSTNGAGKMEIHMQKN